MSSPITDLEKGMMARIVDYQKLRDKIMQVICDHNDKPEKWLDTGCGTGGSIRSAIESNPETYFVLAEPSMDNLMKAREVTKDLSFCEFINSTTDELTLDSGSFDVITSILSHHYYSDMDLKKKAFSNCYRMLNKDGIYVTVEHTIHKKDQSSYDEEWASYMWDHGLDEESIKNMFQRRNTAYFPKTEDELITMLKDSGFEDVQVFWRTCSDVGLYATK